VEDMAASGVELICAHAEVLNYPSLFLGKVHQCGKRAGLALNIKTPVAFLEPYADALDQIIIVSCEADVEGLPFRPGVLKKISDARSFLRPDTQIWVDGGVNAENLKSVIDAGADCVVLGRAIFGNPDPVKAYRDLLEMGRHYQKERDAHEV